MRTCLACGAKSPFFGPAHHHNQCLRADGAEWVCSCVGQYCDEGCDGRWEWPGGTPCDPDELNRGLVREGCGGHACTDRHHTEVAALAEALADD